MPKKPTENYGYISFGKDGTVEKVVKRLSDEKADQEEQIGNKFASDLSDQLEMNFECKQCEENDHDFWLRSGDLEIQVQATEVVSRDFLHKLSMDDYLNSNHKYQLITYRSHDEIYGHDIGRKDAVLLDRLLNKLKKNYSKPNKPLWLLIWTVSDSFFPFSSTNGKPRVSNGIAAIREYLNENGAFPFDEVWFLHLNLRSNRIWPE